MDINSLYHRLMDTYESTDEEVDIEEDDPSFNKHQSQELTTDIEYAEDWKEQIKILFDALWNSEDSYPFKMPVDNMKFPGMYI